METLTPRGKHDLRNQSPPLPPQDDDDEKSREFDGESDEWIDEQIKKNKGYLLLPLKDNGVKLRARIKLLEEEKERRRRRLEMHDSGQNDDVHEKLMQSKKRNFTSASSSLMETTSLPVRAPRSEFATMFNSKLDEVSPMKVDTRVVNAFESELSCLGHGRNINSQLMRQNSARGQLKNMSSSRESPFKCPTKLSVDANKCNKSSDDQRKSMLSSRQSPFRCSTKVSANKRNKSSDDQPKSTWSSLMQKRKTTSSFSASTKLKPWSENELVLVDEDEVGPDQDLPIDADKQNLSSRNPNRYWSNLYPQNFEDSSSDSFLRKKSTFPIVASKDSRPTERKPCILVDMDEPESDLELDLVESMGEAEEVDERFNEGEKDCTIKYPSRDDPEVVEICYSDMDCLAPKKSISSTIINFYIRYLQQPELATERGSKDCLFFNTYFYKKLTEAIAENQAETSFSKFRRWWKGVNIFEKAYILLPIHDAEHWSLAIICMPAKEDYSGPIVLHLDSFKSLRLHRSSSIFSNIKRFLRKEWEHLNEGEAPRDLPFSSKVWDNLPYRVDEKIIEVPQQKNDFDCGLFVLYFMELFIAKAPPRLKRRDLAMFGKSWFRPDEASKLRTKIRKLLMEEFRKLATENSVSAQIISLPTVQEDKFEQPIESPNFILVDLSDF